MTVERQPRIDTKGSRKDYYNLPQIQIRLPDNTTLTVKEQTWVELLRKFIRHPGEPLSHERNFRDLRPTQFDNWLGAARRALEDSSFEIVRVTPRSNIYKGQKCSYALRKKTERERPGEESPDLSDIASSDTLTPEIRTRRKEKREEFETNLVHLFLSHLVNKTLGRFVDHNIHRFIKVILKTHNLKTYHLSLPSALENIPEEKLIHTVLDWIQGAVVRILEKKQRGQLLKANEDKILDYLSVLRKLDEINPNPVLEMISAEIGSHFQSTSSPAQKFPEDSSRL